MKNKLKYIFFTSLISLVVLPISFVYAADPLDANCTNAKAKTDSAVCKSRTDDNPLTGADGLIINIANIVAFVAGAAAVIMLIVGGIQYITAGGDPANAKNARNTILYALIGIAIIVLARVLVIYIVKQL